MPKSEPRLTMAPDLWATGWSAFPHVALVSSTIKWDRTIFQPGMVAHACNPSTWEAEVGRLLEASRDQSG